ncbi:uncharacterized protein FFFS_16028 [Fusarium fujikuroi]|nr:uncharacterized protein FFFS_16028 [Fusarium fujikuroi]
MLIIDIIR